ncbi:hypothetical protein [Escherichia coli]|nr:hypothetical protein [Escherichia coli]
MSREERGRDGIMVKGKRGKEEEKKGEEKEKEREEEMVEKGVTCREEK